MIEVENKVQRYERYKESGVEWLGEIPEHWSAKKLKFIGNVYAGISGKKGDDFSKEYSKGIKSFIPFTNICNNIIIDENQYQFVKIDEKENQNRVLKNDILFLMSSETLDDIAKCSIYLGNDKELYLNSFCKGFRITKTKIYPEYINYLLSSKVYRNYFALVGRGFTRINLKQDFINNATVTLPPLSEQTKIAQFLDDKTTKIDDAIAIKEQQINLLKERKQILIHKAVTRGLDDSVTLKDSGVEWIGEIPDHWEVKKFKHFTRILSGYSPEQVKFSITPKLDYFKVDNLNDVDSKNRLNSSKWFVEEYSVNKIYDKNILLIPKRGGAIGTNKIAITTKKSVFDTNVMGLEFNHKMVSIDLISIWIKSRNLITIADTTTIPQINNKHIYPLEIALPILEEQEEILEYIETASQKIETAIGLKQQEIAKLKEYKSSLINGVVTGKVKVC